MKKKKLDKKELILSIGCIVALIIFSIFITITVKARHAEARRLISPTPYQPTLVVDAINGRASRVYRFHDEENRTLCYYTGSGGIWCRLK